MANMTDAQELAVTRYLTAGVQPAALTAPLRVQLVSALGSGDAPSTPITGGTTPMVPYGATATNPATNAAVLRFEGLPNPTTVAGFRIVDSSATPVVTLDNIPRTGGSITVTDGIVEVPAGALSTTSA